MHVEVRVAVELLWGWVFNCRLKSKFETCRVDGSPERLEFDHKIVLMRVYGHNSIATYLGVIGIWPQGDFCGKLHGESIEHAQGL